MKEVVIIGGGIVGLCCAYELLSTGSNITIIDKGDFTSGCSYGNSGMIVPSHFTPLASPGMIAKGLKWIMNKKSPFYIRPRLNFELAQWLWQFYRSSNKKHVVESAPLLRDMHIEGREFYQQLNSLSGFHFNYEKKGILMMYQTRNGEKEEADAAEEAHHLGIEANILSLDALNELEPGILKHALGAVHFPGDAHLSPHKLMPQMITHLKNEGVEFLKQSEVKSFEDYGAKGCRIIFDNNSFIEAKTAIIAAGSWSGILMKNAKHNLPMQDGKGYSITFERPEGMPSIPSILTEARVAITPMGDQLRVAGTLEISGMDERINPYKVSGILESARHHYPDLKIQDTNNIWFGYRPCTPDGMPYIGRLKNNSAIILATGHAMMGLSLAPATGRMVKEILTGKGQSSALLFLTHR